jgi:Flp pilus assembly protein TadD
MSQNDTQLESAMLLHQSGQLDQAESIYRQILTRDPKHADALHLLGVIHAQRGRHAEAEPLIRQAISIAPNNPEYFRNLGLSMTQSGRVDDALFCYANVIKLQPKDHVSLNQLSILLTTRAQYPAAIAASKAAVAQKPNNPEYIGNLGTALLLNKEYQLAAAEFREAIRWAPKDFRFWHGLGAALGEGRQNADALDALNHLLELKPDFAGGWSNKSAVLRALDRFEESKAAAKRALELDPNCPGAYNNLGALLYDEGKWIETRDAWRIAAKHEPDSAATHWNYSRILLLLGEFEEGWNEFESRVHVPGMRLNRGFTKPQWDGSDPSGKTILLHTEGGFGDALNFIRLAPEVISRGGRWLLECQPDLVRLFQDNFKFEQFIQRGEPIPDHDCHIPLQGLPRILKIRLETIPNQVPYLKARPELVESWARRLKNETKIRVGLNWCGSRPARGDLRTRSIDVFAPLAELEGVKFFSLQKGDAGNESPPSGMDFVNHTAEIRDFADAAAFIQNLDLVISVDTSVVHLAGAMAKPVWVLVPRAPDFRWLIDREDSPWYPTMRLFRQPLGTDGWDVPMGKMVTALRQFKR